MVPDSEMSLSNRWKNGFVAISGYRTKCLNQIKECTRTLTRSTTPTFTIHKVCRVQSVSQQSKS